VVDIGGIVDHKLSFHNTTIQKRKMNYHRDCNWSNMVGATSGAGTAYRYVAHEYTPGFSGIRVARSLVFSVVLCRSLLSYCPFFF